MGLVAQEERYSILQWSPSSTPCPGLKSNPSLLLAAASHPCSLSETSYLSPTGSRAPTLEIFRVDLQTSALNVVARVETKSIFHSMAWGGLGTSPMGWIATGHADGSIQVHDVPSVCKYVVPVNTGNGITTGPPVLSASTPTMAGTTAAAAAQISSSAPPTMPYVPKAILSRVSSDASARWHTAPISTMAFNPFTNSLLAAASTDAEISIWDLKAASLDNPTVYSPSGQTTPQRENGDTVSGAGAGGSAAPAAGIISGVSGAPGGGELATARTSATIDHPPLVPTIAWNQKVQHILAVASSVGGPTLVWDLKQKRPVIGIKDPSGNRKKVTSISWNPAVATQVLITSNDDQYSQALLWDLRNASTPIITFQHHFSGVLASSWCPHDTSMVLTSGSDARIALFSIDSPSNLIAQYPPQALIDLAYQTHPTVQQPSVLDLTFSPKVPGLFATCSTDGKLSVHSLLTPYYPLNSSSTLSKSTMMALADSFGVDSSEFVSNNSNNFPNDLFQPTTQVPQRFPVDIIKPPHWLKKQAAVSFGFGGRIASAAAANSSVVQISQILVTEPELVTSATRLETELQAITADSIRTTCEEMAKASSKIESDAWNLLALQLQLDTRRAILKYLGFEPSETSSHNSSIVGLLNSLPIMTARKAPEPLQVDSRPVFHPQQDMLQNETLNETQQEAPPTIDLNAPAPWDVGDENILATEEHQDNDITSLGADVKATIEEENVKTSADLPKNSPVSTLSIDEKVKRFVLVGNLEAAVDLCLASNRSADALLLAHCGGETLWANALQRFLETYPQGLVRDVAQTLAGTATALDFIKKHGTDNNKWKETLAIILTYSTAPEIVERCSVLGNQLLQAGNSSAALACFTCALDPKRVASVFKQEIRKTKKGVVSASEKFSLLKDLVRRIRIYNMASSYVRTGIFTTDVYATDGDDVSASLYLEYSAILASQGQCALAQKYVQNLSPNILSAVGHADDVSSRIQTFNMIQQQARPLGSTPYEKQIMSTYDQVDNANYGGTPALAQNPYQSYPGSSNVYNTRVDSNAQIYGNSGMTTTTVGNVHTRPQPQRRPAAVPPPNFTQQPGPPSPQYMYGANPGDNMTNGNVYSNSNMMAPDNAGTYPPKNSMNAAGARSGKRLAPPPVSFSGGTSGQPSAGAAMNPPPFPPGGGANYMQNTPSMAGPGGLGGPNAPPPPPTVTTRPKSDQRKPGPPPMTFPAPGSITPQQQAPMGLPPTTAPPPPPPPPQPQAQPAPSMHQPAPVPVGGSIIPNKSNMGEYYGNNMQSNTPDMTIPASTITTGAPTYTTMTPTSGLARATPPPPVTGNGSGSGTPNYRVRGDAGMGRKVPASAEVAGIVAAKKNPPVIDSGSEKEISLEEADVSGVGSDLMPIVHALRKTLAMVRDMNPSPVFKKKMEDVSKKLGRLINRLNAGELNEEIINKLLDLGEVLERNDWDGSLAVIKKLTMDHWDENSSWILALKRLVESAKMGR